MSVTVLAEKVTVFVPCRDGHGYSDERGIKSETAWIKFIHEVNGIWRNTFDRPDIQTGEEASATLAAADAPEDVRQDFVEVYPKAMVAFTDADPGSAVFMTTDPNTAAAFIMAAAKINRWLEDFSCKQS